MKVAIENEWDKLDYLAKGINNIMGLHSVVEGGKTRCREKGELGDGHKQMTVMHGNKPVLITYLFLDNTKIKVGDNLDPDYNNLTNITKYWAEIVQLDDTVLELLVNFLDRYLDMDIAYNIKESFGIDIGERTEEEE